MPERPSDRPVEQLPPLRGALARHVAELRACTRCPAVYGPPVVGPVDDARVYLMGQAPGPKEREAGRPFVWTAGTTLFKWFASIGVDETAFRGRVYMGAVIRCFPGKLVGKQGDRRPAREEIANCAGHWTRELALLRPALVLLVGKMAIDLFLPGGTLNDVVGPVHSVERAGYRFDALPLPHPSGLNRWVQHEPGKTLLIRALDTLAAHPAWQATFPQAGRPGR